MDTRDAILEKVRTALGRKLGQKPLPPPEPLLRVGFQSAAAKLASFHAKFIGTVTLIPDCATVAGALEKLLDGQSAVASGHPFLQACGITEVVGVTTNPVDLRN